MTPKVCILWYLVQQSFVCKVKKDMVFFHPEDHVSIVGNSTSPVVSCFDVFADIYNTLL